MVLLLVVVSRRAAAVPGVRSKKCRKLSGQLKRCAAATQQTAPGSQHGCSGLGQPSGKFEYSLVPLLLPSAFAFACSRSRQPGCITGCSPGAKLAKLAKLAKPLIQIDSYLG